MLDVARGRQRDGPTLRFRFKSGIDRARLRQELVQLLDDLVDAEIVRYPSYDGTLIPALYYKPHNMPKDSKFPALLWIHGGPGGQSTVGYNYLIQYLVNHGYPILCVNNRGSSGYGKSFFTAASFFLLKRTRLYSSDAVSSDASCLP